MLALMKPVAMMRAPRCMLNAKWVFPANTLTPTHIAWVSAKSTLIMVKDLRATGSATTSTASGSTTMTKVLVTGSPQTVASWDSGCTIKAPPSLAPGNTLIAQIL